MFDSVSRWIYSGERWGEGGGETTHAWESWWDWIKLGVYRVGLNTKRKWVSEPLIEEEVVRMTGSTCFSEFVPWLLLCVLRSCLNSWYCKGNSWYADKGISYSTNSPRHLFLANPLHLLSGVTWLWLYVLCILLDRLPCFIQVLWQIDANHQHKMCVLSERFSSWDWICQTISIHSFPT